jgi:hypothetical protein
MGAKRKGKKKRPGREVDHSPPFSAEVKNAGAIPPTPIRFRGMALNYSISQDQGKLYLSLYPFSRLAVNVRAFKYYKSIAHNILLLLYLETMSLA